MLACRDVICCLTATCDKSHWALQVDLEKVWVMFSSIVLAFAFMFGNSVRTVYESIIYLFVVHPFDVGDKIIVDSVSSKVCTLTCHCLASLTGCDMHESSDSPFCHCTACESQDTARGCNKQTKEQSTCVSSTVLHDLHCHQMRDASILP